jgi:phospholipase C
MDVEGRQEGSNFKLILRTNGPPRTVLVKPNAYAKTGKRIFVPAQGQAEAVWPTFHGWYDLTLTASEAPGWSRRLAGRLETGKPSISDPAMGGTALMET